MMLVAFACGRPPPSPAPPSTDTATTVEVAAPTLFDVQVTLDGAPAAGVLVQQPGTLLSWTTDAGGLARVSLDPTVDGEWFVTAMHPEARIEGAGPPEAGETAVIALERFDPADNPAYVFQDPGTPDRRETTDQCAHCHWTIGDDWWDSPHRTSASNPTVQDLYDSVSNELGGAFGGCADCHAPGIDGALGGRDLREADGIALEGGVHCDVCHKVESVDLDAPAGVAGRLHLVRPSEPSTMPSFDWRPLSFGPYADSPQVQMGSVYRALFHEASLCAGCHQLDQPVLVPGASVDLARWPEGLLPVHSTYAEWLAGPMNPAAPCASCHMPPDPTVGNAADLGNHTVLPAGVVNGWYRPPGAVRRHTFDGPRTRSSGMLELAASLSVSTALDGGVLTADVTVKNVGPGHAIPTGDPLRSLLLLVSARCGGVEQAPIGGDAVPDYGGAEEHKVAGEDWTRWANAGPGDVVRVVRQTGEYRDYSGHGSFGDGTFDAVEKGLPVEMVVGAATIVAVTDGVAAFDRPLPEGDVAYLGLAAPLPADGEVAAPRAGAAGFGFARVLVAADGRRMVPHYEAVDVVSDNRLLPQQSATTHHVFQPACADPQVTAVLVHRAYPFALAAERQWSLVESVMAEVTP